MIVLGKVCPCFVGLPLVDLAHWPGKAHGVVTVYYRMHAKVAEDLLMLLPQLVRPESWNSDANSDAPGAIFIASSAPELSVPAAQLKVAAEAKRSPQTVVMERAVLIIRQTRAAHDEIAEVIRRVESGDARALRQGDGGLGGGGGFGGGFFSVP